MSRFKRLFGVARRCFWGGAVVLAVAVGAAARPGPRPISSFEELQKIGVDEDYPLDGHYELTQNIDWGGFAESGKWPPIGKSNVMPEEWVVNCPPIPGINCNSIAIDALYSGAFTGVFDGAGHTISGLYISRRFSEVIFDPDDPNEPAPTVVSAGLFGALNGATVMNLTIEADSVIVSGSYHVAGGILAGFSRNSTIRNVRVAGALVGIGVSTGPSADLSLGGLVGTATTGKITGCSSAVALAGLSYQSIPSVVPIISNNKIGGLVGVSEGAEISGGIAVAKIDGTGFSAGGLVGENLGGKITKSGAGMTGGFWSTLNPNVVVPNVGGLAGVNSIFVPVVICPPDVSCDPPIPLIGEITQSYSIVDMNVAGGRAGGLVGAHNAGLIADSYSDGIIHGMAYGGTAENNIFGGLAGVVNSCDAKIQNSYSVTKIIVEGPPTVVYVTLGGLVGWNEGGCRVLFVRDSYWDTTATGITVCGGGGIGKSTAEMTLENTFVDWDFTNIWRMRVSVMPEGNGYPALAWQIDGSTSISRDNVSLGSARNRFAPTATVRGKTLNVRTPSPTANLQIRVIDMRGRTMTRFITTGNGNFSLNKISAGRYIVEMRDVASGQRYTSPIVLR